MRWPLGSTVVLTQDWRPPGHLSFASAHPGRKPYETIEVSYGPQILWPDHCVQGTLGAEFRRDLQIPHAQLVLRKGYHSDIDSYSAFCENDRKTRTGLAGYLRERSLRRVFLAGLAFDFCVRYSGEDAKREGFDVVVIEDAAVASMSTARCSRRGRASIASARAAFAPTPSADVSPSGGEAQGPVGEQARTDSHQFLAVGDHSASVLGEQLHVPGHAFLVGGGGLGDRSRRRQLADQLGRQGHSRLRTRHPCAVDLLQGVEELLLHFRLFLPHFAECAGREGRAWPVQRLAENICHVNLPYLSGPTTCIRRERIDRAHATWNRLPGWSPTDRPAFSRRGCRRPVSRDIPPIGDGLQVHR